MTLHHLEIFTCVCAEKTTHAAAQKLNLSQPAVSKAISELERYYNIRLFERVNRRLCLTPTGEMVRRHALAVLESFAQMEYAIAQRENQNHVRIGASVSVGTCLLPPLLPLLEGEGISYQIVVHNTSKIEQLAQELEIDFGLVEGHVENSSLVIQDIAEDELVVAASARHPLAQKQQLDYADLEKWPFVSREGGSSTRNQLELYLQQLGLNLWENYSCTNTEAIKQALLYTNSIAILSKMVIKDEIKAGALVALPLQRRFTRNIRFICHKQKYRTWAMEKSMSLLEQGIQQRTSNPTA